MKERRIWAHPVIIVPWQHKTVSVMEINQDSVIRNFSIGIKINPSGPIKAILSENNPNDFAAASVERKFELTSEEYRDDETVATNVENYKAVSSASQTEIRTQDVNLLKGAYLAVETSYELLSPGSKTETIAQDSRVSQSVFLAVKNNNKLSLPTSETEVTTQDENLLQGAYSTGKTNYEIQTAVSETETSIQDASLSQRIFVAFETSNVALNVLRESEAGIQHFSSTEGITVPQTNGILNSEFLSSVPSTRLTVKQDVMAVENQGVSSVQEETTCHSTAILNSGLGSCVPHMRLTGKSEKSSEEIDVRSQDVSPLLGKVISNPVGVLDSVSDHHPPLGMSDIKQENLRKEIIEVVGASTPDANAQEILYPTALNSELNSCLSSVRVAAEGENSVEGTVKTFEVRTEDGSFLHGEAASFSSNAVDDRMHSHMPCWKRTSNQNSNRLMEFKSEGKISPLEKLVFCIGSKSVNGSNNHVSQPKVVINQKLKEQAKVRFQEKVNGLLNNGRNYVPQSKFTLEQKLVELADIKSQKVSNSAIKAVSNSNNLPNQESNQYVPYENVSIRHEKTGTQANATNDPMKYHSVASHHEESFSDEAIPAKVLSESNKTAANKSALVPKTLISRDDGIGFSKMPVAFLYKPKTAMDTAKIPFNLTSSEGVLKDVVMVMPENAIPVLADNVQSVMPKHSIPVSGIPEIFIPVVSNNVLSVVPDSEKSVTVDNVISHVPDNANSWIPVNEWTMCSRCSKPFQSPPVSKKLTMLRSDEPPDLCKHCCARLKRANYLYSHMNKITCRGIWSPSTKRTKR